MLAYVVRRLFATIVVMAVVAFVVFLLLYLTPGDPAAILAGDAATSDDIRRIREKLGLDEPFLSRFGGWLWRLLHGDLGVSIFTNLPVTHLIGQRIEPTLSLTLCTLVIAVLVAVPLGVIAAARAGTWVDRTVMASCLSAVLMIIELTLEARNRTEFVPSPERLPAEMGSPLSEISYVLASTCLIVTLFSTAGPAL